MKTAIFLSLVCFSVVSLATPSIPQTPPGTNLVLSCQTNHQIWDGGVGLIIYEQDASAKLLVRYSTIVGEYEKTYSVQPVELENELLYFRGPNVDLKIFPPKAFRGELEVNEAQFKLTDHELACTIHEMGK